MVKTALVGFTVLAAASLGVSLAGWWPLPVGLGVATVAFLATLQRRSAWGIALVVIVNALAIGVGVWVQAPPVWLVLGGVATLAAWNLHGFACYLASVADVSGRQTLERRHLRRLLWVAGVGTAAAAAALRLRTAFSLGGTLFFALIGALGLGQLVRALRRSGE